MDFENTIYDVAAYHRRHYATDTCSEYNKLTNLEYLPYSNVTSLRQSSGLIVNKILEHRIYISLLYFDNLIQLKIILKSNDTFRPMNEMFQDIKLWWTLTNIIIKISHSFICIFLSVFFFLHVCLIKLYILLKYIYIYIYIYNWKLNKPSFGYYKFISSGKENQLLQIDITQ